MTTVPFDIPAALAGPAIAILTTAVAYLMTVDWTHPDTRHNQEQP
jgi:hypothetical protein